MNAMKLAIPLFVALAYGPAQAQILGSELGSFAVLGATAVTNASGAGDAATIITGNLGVSPGSSITGFPPGIVTGTIQPGTEAAAQAQLTSAYTSLGNLAVTGLISAGGLSGANLTPGVYAVTSTAFDLTTSSTLTLNGAGSEPGLWVFLMSSSLITGSNTKVDVSSLGADDSVYWIVRSSATLGDNADFAGNILALTSIGFNPGATDLCGRALAQNGLVSFDGVGTTVAPGESVVEPNKVGGGCGSSNGLNSIVLAFDTGGNVVDTDGTVVAAIPEPEIYAMMAVGLGLMGWVGRRKRLKEAAAA